MDNNLRILNHLARHQEQSFTMHQLSKELKIPYATFHRTIQQMTDLLKIQKVGTSKTLSLNKQNPTLKFRLIISSEEQKKEYLKKQPIINKIVKELDTKDVVVLFGSYAKSQQKPNSDIDLLIINKKGEKTIPFYKYETLFKKKINPIFITRQEFKRMIKEEQENVGKQALKNHIILSNPEGFWRSITE